MYTITYINSKKCQGLTSNELDDRLNSVQTAHRSTQPSSPMGLDQFFFSQNVQFWDYILYFHDIYVNVLTSFYITSS